MIEKVQGCANGFRQSMELQSKKIRYQKYKLALPSVGYSVIISSNERQGIEKGRFL